MGEIRNAERTRKNILKAASTEFFEKGYSGARIETIAANAGITKQLLYRYFKGKDELYREVFGHLFEGWGPDVFMMPANPVQIAEHRFKVNAEQLLGFLRFTVWEAIDPGPGSLMGEELRRKVLHSYIADMRDKQEMGLVPEQYDPAMLTLAISSLTIYPLIFGDVTKLITGKLPTDPDFQEEWKRLLRSLSERIFGGK
ncbi:TetR family transcriptional regulator [Cohnella sp. CFH 77786]|uniref:TetR/AcrR family transcriptional regulator n=1 Tax=Cohnella sp. CFH 77786 TaxID=2662265 RepID=UPI001C60A739|nr:TetR/AcrR family transcriptional regulator [Cohnella sp. CFH 77786]MBW5446187.1 TetR family transcriptional regulator [Cohnella sp. CFH 77786]